MTFVCVYAVASGVPVRLGRGAAREPLRSVARGDLAMIVGDLDAPLLPVPATLVGYDAVVRRLAVRCRSLLPVRFGFPGGTDGALRAHLRTHARAFRTALRNVEGCRQMTVRVFGRSAVALARRGRRWPSGGPGTRYLQRRADLCEAEHRLPEMEPLRAAVDGLVRAERVVRHDAAGLVGTAYHLVESSRVATYRRRVRRAAEVLRPLRVHVSGPWAPYAFAPEDLV